MIYRVTINAIDGGIHSVGKVESETQENLIVLYVEASSKEEAIKLAKHRFGSKYKEYCKSKRRKLGLCPLCGERPVSGGSLCREHQKEESKRSVNIESRRKELGLRPGQPMPPEAKKVGGPKPGHKFKRRGVPTLAAARLLLETLIQVKGEFASRSRDDFSAWMDSEIVSAREILREVQNVAAQ